MIVGEKNTKTHKLKTTFYLIANILISHNVSAYTLSTFIGTRAPLLRGINSAGRSVLRMEDFGILRNTGLGFDDIWGGESVISERILERELNSYGIRYRMNRTVKECKDVENIDLMKIGPFGLKLHGVVSIWEAFGFTATSNNEARQKCKKEAQENAANDPTGIRAKYLGKYGYPRLVGTNGIFYADQLSSDSEPMGGFGMGKSGVIWPVPDVIHKDK